MSISWSPDTAQVLCSRLARLRATSAGGASAACLDGHESLKYFRDQTQQNSSTLGFTMESRCCSLLQSYMAHITWAHQQSTAVPVHVGRQPATLTVKHFFELLALTNLLFLKYMEGLEGVGILSRSCQHEKIIHFSPYRHLNDSLLAYYMESCLLPPNANFQF